MFHLVLTSLGPRCIRRTLALTLVLVLLGVTPAMAQLAVTPAHESAVAPFETELTAATPAHAPVPRAAGRGIALTALEASFVGLQALDTISTLRALDRGLVEANPIMRPITSRPAAFVAVKAGTTVGMVFLTRRLSNHSRLAGILFLVAADSAYSFVVARNFALAAGR